MKTVVAYIRDVVKNVGQVIIIIIQTPSTLCTYGGAPPVGGRGRG